MRAALLALLVMFQIAAPVAAAQGGESPTGEQDPLWSRGEAGQVVTTTAHFDVAALDDPGLAALARRVGDVAEEVLPTAEARLEASLQDRVRLEVWPGTAAGGRCPARAATMPTRRRIVLFASPATSEPAALHAFLAHELGHQLTYDRWDTLGPDRRLSEGLATYAAEPYWLAWRGWSSLDAGVAELQAAGALPASADEPRGCLVASQRDVYYSAWASFVGFLVRRYGWERFGEALQLPAVAEDRADYQDAFGSSLDELVAAWEQTLPAPPGATPTAVATPPAHGAGPPQ